jgi:hypothetical protein
VNQSPRWSDDQFRAGLEKAKVQFRDERIREPLEAYTRAFDVYQTTVSNLLDATDGLTQLSSKALVVLTSTELFEAFRYLAGPPISKDDLSVLADAQLSPTRLRENPAMLHRVLQIVLATLDPRRFPWVKEGREPTESETFAATISSAALLAVSRVGTSRRSEAKERQEQAVCEALIATNWAQVQPRSVSTFNQAPGPGEFCRESLFGVTKADFLLGLWDRRVMAIECKVSNSSTNSVKRLNREAAGKAEYWIKEFGARNVVPIGVLSGVFKLHNLRSAQERGLTIYWAHDLPELLGWIQSTRP